MDADVGIFTRKARKSGSFGRFINFFIFLFFYFSIFLGISTTTLSPGESMAIRARRERRQNTRVHFLKMEKMDEIFYFSRKRNCGTRSRNDEVARATARVDDLNFGRSTSHEAVRWGRGLFI